VTAEQFGFRRICPEPSITAAFKFIEEVREIAHRPEVEQVAAFAKVTLEDLLGWFTHCCYCTKQA